MRAIALAVVVSSVALGAHQAAQTPPRDAPPPTGGTAAVSGRVTEKDSGKPLRGYRVSVNRQSAGDERTIEAETDAEGRFAISGLAPGEYYASAAPGEYRAGHLGRAFGAGDALRAPFSPPPYFELKSGEIKRDLDFALERTFAIEGRVVNEYGEGLSDIEISGHRTDGQFGGTAAVTSDDRGQFRAYNVARGSWRICARPGYVWPGPPTGGASLDVRFARTCFPSDGARGIEVTSSDVAGVLITMRRERAYSIAGQVLDETGAPAPDARVQIEALDRFFPTGSPVSPEVSNGSFVAAGFLSGEYLVRAAVQAPPDPYAMRGSHLGPRQMGVTAVRIEASDVTGVIVTISQGVAVAGRLRFEGQPDALPSPARFSVVGQRARDDQPMYQNMSTPVASVDNDWSFELRRVYGPIVVAAADKAGEWILKSVRYGVTDITGIPTQFEATSGPRVLELVLTNSTAKVTARALDADGNPAADAVVLMLPANPARWKAMFIVPTRPEKDGRFVMPSRAPGEYVIAALSGWDAARLMRNPDDFPDFAARARRVSLEAGEHTLDLKILRLYEAR